jgi:hypothetical protein
MGVFGVKRVQCSMMHELKQIKKFLEEFRFGIPKNHTII